MKLAWASVASRGLLSGAAGQRIHFDREETSPNVSSLSEKQFGVAQETVEARRRGYFTPDEDDRVRQMLLAYRSYRLGIYEIICRYFDYEQITDPTSRLRAF